MPGCVLHDSASASDNKENFDQASRKISNTGYAQLARMIRGSSLAREGDLDAALVDFKQLLMTRLVFWK